MLDNNDAFKYETLYKVILEIMQCWTNVMVASQCGAIKIRYHILQVDK